MPWQLEQEVTNAVGAAPGVDAVSHDEDSETVVPAVPPPTTVLPALPPPMTVLPALPPVGDVPELPAELDVSPGVVIDPGIPPPVFVVCPEQPTLAAIAQRLAATATIRAVNAALTGSRFEIMRSPSVETARHVTLMDFAGPRS